MNKLDSEKEIHRISYDLLRGSKSLDIFPTPIDKIVSYADLIVQTEDISKIHYNYISKFPDLFKSFTSKVRGLLDRREKIIYLDLSQVPARQNFVKLHEVGHNVLDWQRKIHEVLGDDDASLDPDTREQFEAEASFFASATLFQLDRFDDEIGKLGLGIDAVMFLATKFGASRHATFRRYVECSKNRCALLVLEKPSTLDGQNKCYLRNQFQSDNFSKDFGFIKIPQELGYDWTFVNDYCRNRRYIKDGAITILTRNGSVDFHYHFFNNTYNAFVFFFPKGEKKSTRTQIILTGIET